ncbi:MAG: NUDIX hydrolase [Gemmatimonadota bacterium]
MVYRVADGVPNFLLIRDPYENWGLPKGHMERGESPEQTALREVEEETGLDDLELREPLGTIDWFFREGPDLIHKYCHFFLMETRMTRTEPQVDEGITACIWLPLDEALERLTYDNARTVLERAGERVRGAGGGEVAP